MPVTELTLADDLMSGLLDGSKRCTIRAGKRYVQRGPLIFEGAPSGTRVRVNVTHVTHKMLSHLTDAEALMNGADTAKETALALKRFYPDITDKDDITVIEYEQPHRLF